VSLVDRADRRALPGFWTSLAVQLGALGALLAVAACCGGLGAASAPVTGPFGLLGGLLCFAMAAPVLGLGAGLLLRRSILAPFDRAWAALDPAPRRFLLSGRAWLGEHAGRDVQVAFMRGPVLQVTMACDARTRFAVGWKTMVSSGVAGLVGMAEVPLPGTRDDLGAFAADPDWGRHLLAGDDVVSALRCLLEDDDLATLRTVNVEPDCVMLTLRRPRYGPGPAEATALLDALARLATAAESVPLPADPLTPSALVTRFRPAALRVPPRSG